MNGKAKWLVLALALAALYGAAAFYFSGEILHFKQRTLEEDRQNLKISGPAQFDITAEPETYALESAGVTLRGWLVRGRPGRCAVILHHGHTGTRHGGLKYGQLFVKRGCHLMFPDARYHGESGGDYGTYGALEKQDMQVLIDYLVKTTGVPVERVGLLGESMGGAISLLAGTLRPQLAFVGADSAYSDLRTVFKEHGARNFTPAVLLLFGPAFALAEWRSGVDLDEVSPARHGAKLSMPVFLVHSKQDAATSPAHSQRIYDSIPHARKVLHFSDFGARHGRSINVNRTWYTNRMEAFLEKHVPDFGR